MKLSVETREDGKPITGAVSYESVPSYLVAADQTVEVEGRGSVPYDLCFAGTFYAMVNAEVVGTRSDQPAVWTLHVTLLYGPSLSHDCLTDRLQQEKIGCAYLNPCHRSCLLVRDHPLPQCGG